MCDWLQNGTMAEISNVIPKYEKIDFNYGSHTSKLITSIKQMWFQTLPIFGMVWKHICYDTQFPSISCFKALHFAHCSAKFARNYAHYIRLMCAISSAFFYIIYYMHKMHKHLYLMQKIIILLHFQLIFCVCIVAQIFLKPTYILLYSTNVLAQMTK